LLIKGIFGGTRPDQYEAAYEKRSRPCRLPNANRQTVARELKSTQALYKGNLASEADLEAVKPDGLAERQVFNPKPL
jgi:hypothetical protein